MYKKIVFSIVIIIMIVALVEFCSYVLYHSIIKLKHKSTENSYFEFSPYLLWENKSHVEGYSKYSRYYQNNFGFRNDYPINKNPSSKTFRIIAIGGSVAWGTGANCNKTVWTKILEDSLNQNHTIDRNQSTINYQILNAGCSGYISFQELILLENKLLDFQPDLIIVLDGWNDIYYASLETEDDYCNNEFHYTHQLRLHYKSSFIPQIFNIIKNHSNFFILLNRSIDYLVYHSAKESKIYSHEKGINNYIKNLEYMAAILKSKNIPFYIILQPYIGFSSELSKEETKILSLFKQRNKIIKKLLISTEKHITNNNHLKNHFFSLLSDFKSPSQKNIWFDHIHLNDEGQKVLANKIYYYLKAEKVIK